ncbi:MAG: DNA polymerase III subunit gamma/tau [Adlercreutzia sp.]
MAEALYRKYRPQIFEDVVGQEHIERTIKNAIAQDKVSHAYLFTGPRGTGKTTTARLLAKALLCEKGPTAEPDGTCDDCEMIAAGEHPDVYELDAASRTGVENVREEIIGRVQFAPTRGRYKVYIIDEVHMLSTAAFNALLKTLEEPPSHVVFILATTDPQKVPETIHSRCQRFDFRRISTEAMVSRLGAICTAENVEFEGEALELIAHRAEGGMRNALTSLEQLIAFGDGAVTMEVAERMLGAVDSTDLADIVRTIGARDAAACFRWVAEYVETGADMAQFVANLAEHMRNMYVMAVAGPEVVLDVSETTRRELIQELPLFGVDRLARLLGVLGDVAGELKTSTNPRLTFEIALTRMVRPDADVTLEALAERVETLERQLAGASVVAAAPVVPAAAAGSGCPCRGRPWSPLGSSWVSAVRQPVRLARRGATKVCPYGRGCPGGSPCRGDLCCRCPRAVYGIRPRFRTARFGRCGCLIAGNHRRPLEYGLASASLGRCSRLAEEVQGGLRRAVHEHQGGLRCGGGCASHRVPCRERLRLPRRAETRRAGRARPGSAP